MDRQPVEDGSGIDRPFEIEVEGEKFPLERVSSPRPNRWEGKSFCVAVSMVKNEADIIPAWLSHVCSLFDQVYILDHSSLDGTYPYLLEAARSWRNLHTFTFAHQGMFQAEIINRLVEIAAEENPQAWIFPLDADEFISVEGKEDFLSQLRLIPNDRVLTLKWINTLPVVMRRDAPFTFSTPCLIPSHPGGYAKLALHAAAFQTRGWRFKQGNHHLVDRAGNIKGEEQQVAFADLFHLPIRSYAHFVLKCIQGYLAYHTLPAERKDPSQSYHRKAMIEKVNQMGRFDPRMIRTFIVDYGRKSYAGEGETSIRRLLVEGWQSGLIDVAHSPLGITMDREMDFLHLAEKSLEDKDIPLLKEFLGIFKDWQSKYALSAVP
jgi:hypothetical protein